MRFASSTQCDRRFRGRPRNSSFPNIHTTPVRSFSAVHVYQISQSRDIIIDSTVMLPFVNGDVKRAIRPIKRCQVQNFSFANGATRASSQTVRRLTTSMSTTTRATRSNPTRQLTSLLAVLCGNARQPTARIVLVTSLSIRWLRRRVRHASTLGRSTGECWFAMIVAANERKINC